MTEPSRGRRVILSVEEIEGLISRGAEAGSKRVLEGLGVDVDHPLEMQQDFAWMREKRRASKALIDAGKLALVTSIIGAVVAFAAGAWGIIARAATSLGGVPPHHP